MTVLAPKLRHRITFQRHETARNSDGVLSGEWVDVELEGGLSLANWPAEVLTGPGREARASGQVLSEIKARITCRWFPGLDAGWRILYDGEFDSELRYTGQVWNVATWETDITGRREYRIVCTTGLNEGE